MRRRIYIETTVPSFYFSHRSDVESQARTNWTKDWWDHHSADATLLTSAAVLAELSRGTSDLVDHRVALLDIATLLPITQEIEEIAQIYISKKIMPRDPQGDALHLAVAAFYKADILLTWNCIHLANANKFERIRLINFEMGLSTPILTTPLNLLDEGKES